MKNFNSHLIQRIMHIMFMIAYSNSYFNFIWNITSSVSWIKRLDFRC